MTNIWCVGCDLEANGTDDIKVHDALLYCLREQAVSKKLVVQERILVGNVMKNSKPEIDWWCTCVWNITNIVTLP